MKKLIVFSVVFALVAGAAFAEVNFGATTFGKVHVMEGNSVKDSEVHASGGVGRVRLETSGQNDDGTFGGWLRLEAVGGSNFADLKLDKDKLTGATPDFEKGISFNGGTFTGLAWWQPISLLKFQVGVNPDGQFSADGMTRWGFYQDAGDVGIANEHWGFGGAFYGGFGAGGAVLTITPIEALAINIGIPYFAGGRGESVYKKTNAQVAYNIDGIGRLAVTFEGGYEGGDKEDDNWVFSGRNKKLKFDVEPADYSDPADPQPAKFDYGSNGASKFYLYFGLSAIENLGLDVGLGLALPRTEEVMTDVDATYLPPIAAGVGVSFDAGAFGIKLRVQGEFAGNLKLSGDNVIEDPLNDPFVLTADLLPSFAIDDSMKIFLSAGLKFTAERKVEGDWKKANVDAKGDEQEKVADAVTVWHINPYFTKAIGAGKFYAGIRLWSDSSKKWFDGKDDEDGKAIVNWSVPVGVSFSF